MKHALLAGFGGIGKNVYYPELIKLGYIVDVLDPYHPEANLKQLREIKKQYDLAVICTPNFTHKEIAEYLAETGTERIFVEKPGLATTAEWIKLTNQYPNTQFQVVKNNLYRDSYDQLLDHFQNKDVIGVDINWLNGNRIPSPGSWFTTQDLAFGGVSRDLMPHLFCFAVKLFGLDKIASSHFDTDAHQRWNLSVISNTDYGTVNPNGVYNVDDYARAEGIIDFENRQINLRITASWKEGYDKQSITLFFRDGTTYEWNFGLCPAEAYGNMLAAQDNTHELDIYLHSFLERF